MVFRIPVFVGLLTHDSGPVRHKGVAVAAGERRHTRRLGIQLMLKKNRQIFLRNFAECNSHLIRPNANKMSDGGRGRASRAVKVWKSSQMSPGRSGVRSIAWLGLCVASELE